MDRDGVTRAVAAARSLAEEIGLATERVTLVQNSNKLALRLLPCDVFARVARIGQEVAALEVELATRLAAVGAPVAALDPRAAPRVHQRDGFAVTFWTFYETVKPDSTEPGSTELGSTELNLLDPAEQAGALERLHAGMRRVEAETPHFLDRVEEAEVLVNHRNLTPALDDAGRELLLNTFGSVRQRIKTLRAPEQLLHGEPHPGNVLYTAGGSRFIDLETCCRGPVEFDVAHVPLEVSSRMSGLDDDLLSECRRWVLAMVAAWRWDAKDEFPDGLHHGRAILEHLSAGPPWPVLGALGSGPVSGPGSDVERMR